MLLNAGSSITAFIIFLKSVTSPIRISDVICSRDFSVAGHRDFGMYAREAAEHFCPWYSNAPRAIAVASSVGLAELWAKINPFPPVSPTSLGYDL